MLYNNDESALNARDRELWNPPMQDIDAYCVKCGKELYNTYYNVINTPLCKNCARKEFIANFEDFEDLEYLKQICNYDSIEQLIEDTVDEELYKFEKEF